MAVKKDAQGKQPPSSAFNVDTPAIEFDDKAAKLGSASNAYTPKVRALLRSVQEKTGFETYLDYLRFHAHYYPSLRLLFDLFEPYEDDESILGWLVTIISITKSQDVPLLMKRPAFTHSTEVVEALCDPPKDTALQIIFIDVSLRERAKRSQRQVFDFLGLILQLDPRFFHSLLGLHNEEMSNLVRYHPYHVSVGHSVTTVCTARSWSNKVPDVVILAQSASRSKGYPWRYSFAGIDRMEVDGICQFPPLKRSALTVLGGPQLAPDRPIVNDYTLLLFDLLEANEKLKEDFTTMSLVCLLALFRRESLRLERSCADIRKLLLEKLRETKNVPLYESHAKLREDINRLENDRRSLKKYISSPQSRQYSQGQLYWDVEEESKEAIIKAYRVESQVRDFLQLEAGNLGLQASMKSIELSNRQIEEAKRSTLCL